MTIEVLVHPACSRLGSSRIQPSWPLASIGVLTPAQWPDCLTTPNTVGEPNSVRLRRRATSSPPPGSVRIATRWPRRTQITGYASCGVWRPSQAFACGGSADGAASTDAAPAFAARRCAGSAALVAVGVAAAWGGAGTLTVTVGGSADEPQPAATAPATTIAASAERRDPSPCKVEGGRRQPGVSPSWARSSGPIWAIRVWPLRPTVRSSSASSARSTRDDARLAAERQPPEIGAADQHGVGAEGERLEDVGARAHAAVEQHRQVVADRVGDRGQRVERGDLAIDLAATVVGDHDAVDPALARRARVVGVEDALDQRSAARSPRAGTRGRPS